MTDAAALTDEKGFTKATPSETVATSSPDDRLMRPAQASDIRLIHSRLMEAIDTSPHYSDQFKAYEKARLTPGYLRNLLSVDPRHILICLSKGETVGFMVSGPELGVLWLYWSYLFPEFRRQALAMSFLRNFLQIWDNDRYHKVATYTRPGNDVAVALMRRFKFNHTATLEAHMFGEDFMLFEHPLTKVVEGYDRGVNVGFTRRMKNRLLAFIGR